MKILKILSLFLLAAMTISTVSAATPEYKEHQINVKLYENFTTDFEAGIGSWLESRPYDPQGGRLFYNVTWDVNYDQTFLKPAYLDHPEPCVMGWFHHYRDFEAIKVGETIVTAKKTLNDKLVKTIVFHIKITE